MLEYALGCRYVEELLSAERKRSSGRFGSEFARHNRWSHLTMNRKWIALAASVSLSLTMAGGLTMADDQEEGTPLHKVMEQVQKNNSAVLRGVRNSASYKKSQEDVAEAGVKLLKLAKEARSMGKEVAEAQKKEVAEWEKLTDEWISETEKFNKLIADKAEQSDVKDAYKVVSKTCTNCHEVFRVDETSF